MNETELPPEASNLHGEPVSSADSAQNRIARAVRRVSALVVGRPIATGALDDAARTIDEVADALAAAASSGKKPRGLPDHAGHPQDLFPTSPMVGFGNPISPPVRVWEVMGENGVPELRGRAFFDYQFEGPPTCVHGGVLAELFDEMLGSANIVTGRAGMTGTLTIVYRRPTPLLAGLDLAARQTKVEGRKIFAEGTIHHDGELTAEAHGIFIEMIPRNMLKIVAANADNAEGEVIDPELQAFVDQGADIQGVEGPPPR